ncbi:MAG: SRPBCC domain-containing protein [Pseudomonadales bacterium]|nr:SRPBCC domain-containing protein [Pseudomonadales bacterium]
MSNTHLKTQIYINAPVKKVWQVLTDFDNCEWNPLFSKIERNPSRPDKIKLSFRSKLDDLGVPSPSLEVDLTAFEEEYRFAWGSPLSEKFKSLIDAEHYFELYEIDENTTKLVHGEEFSGIVPKVLWKLIEKVEPAYLDLNRKLKTEVEAA